jgi:hypothetical protein
MADGKESGRDRQAAVVGLALRFALIARPAGSQGSAPAKAYEEIRNNKTQEREKKRKNRNDKEGDISKEL